MRASIDTQSQGFALVDSLIALAIIGLMTGVMFETIQSTALASRTISDKRNAVLVAQSVLAVANERTGTAMATQGRDSDFQWTIESFGYENQANSNSAGLEQIKVSVTKIGNPRILVTLSSLRLARR